MMAGVFEAEDIVKYGYMMIKRPPTSAKVRIKAWQSKFFVLRDKTKDLPQRLEYYKDESAFEFQKTAEHCFFLDSIGYIGETHSSKSHCYPILVVCSKQGPFTLGCDNQEATEDWILALNRVAVKVGGNGSPEMWMVNGIDDSPANTPEITRRASTENVSGAVQNLEEPSVRKLSRTRTINSSANAGYFVTTRLTPHSEQNNIRGDYILCITDGEVLLKSVDRSVTEVTWPVGHLRSFLSEPAKTTGVKDMQLLTLNAGRRSATGEGIFQFFTKHGETIADEIRRQSQQAFQSARQKREAFFRGQSLHGRDRTDSSPPTHPAKISRTNTAPPEKLTRMLTKTDKVRLAENSRRLRSETDPTSDKKVEKDSPPVTPKRSSSSSDARPRAATDSSVEKIGDDEVFLSQYCEISDGVQEEADTNEANAYIDLLSDDTAEPIHISDPVPSRKTSMESLTSACSVTSEDASMPRNSSLPRNFSSPRFIPEVDETDSEGYIKCEALQTGPAENDLDGNGNVVGAVVSENTFDNPMFELSAQSRGFSSSPNDPATLKTGGLDLSSANSSINRKMQENLVAQIRDPNLGIFPPKPKLERERVLKSEDAFPPISRRDDEELNAPLSATGEIDPAHALLEQAMDPESSKQLLDQIIAQMEKPQQHDVSKIFTAATRKRNSIGAVSIEAIRVDQVKGKGGHGFSFTKHSVIEKSKSTCDGFSPRALSPGPPPIPLRPDSVDVRKKPSLSVGDISEELHKRPDFASAHRSSSTFFAKGLSVNPQALMSPLRNNISACQLVGGEAAIHARLIEKTEIRDELAQFSAFRAKPGVVREDVLTCSIADGGNAASCAITDEAIFNIADSGDKSRFKSVENLNEDSQGDPSKRRDSRTSKLVRKVKKLAPKARRGSNESRENDEEYSGPSERSRRESLSPGDALDLQGRFTGSESNTPESSPKMKRKNSKSSPKDKRKLSSDQKSKKDKETSATKMLRKVAKGELKKDEYNLKTSGSKVSREESPKKDVVADDSISKPLSPTHLNASGQGNVGRKSKDESVQNSDFIERLHQSDEQVGQPSDSGGLLSHDIQEPAPAIPPRKKFVPPPLPPRIPRSSPSNSIASPVYSPPPQHVARPPQPVAPPPKEGGRHSSSGAGRHQSSCGLKDDYLPPPPVPPRNTQSPEPKNVQSTNKGSAGRAPVIQLTCSSPENRDDASERQNSDFGDGTAYETTDKTPDSNPPIMSATHRSPDSLSHPIPRRPPKGERRAQARECFRSHASQRVYSPSSDSDGGEMEDNDFPPHSPRYGNIEEIRMTAQRSALEEATSEHRTSQELIHESSASNLVSASSVRVIKSQREAMCLKVNLMKESSVDEDIPFESDDTEAATEQRKPKRPSTPLTIKRNVFTLSSVSIN